jgi:hypothetical protein
MTFLETYFGEKVGVVSLFDEFAQERGTRGPLPLPIPPLWFSLVARDEQNVMTPLDPPIELRAQTGPTGAYLFADEGHIDDEPPFRIAPGKYRLRIDSDYYQRLEHDLDWPPGKELLLLRPGSAYPFPSVTVPGAKLTLLRGTVLGGAQGEPVENATVAIVAPAIAGPFITARTDANGAWVLAFRQENANDINATIRITIGNDPPIDVPNVKIVPGRDNSLSNTALRGNVLSTTGNAIRDAEITVDLVPNTVVRSDRDGRWAFYFGHGQQKATAQVTALAPNGQSDSKQVDVENRKTIVVPTFRIVMN